MTEPTQTGGGPTRTRDYLPPRWVWLTCFAFVLIAVTIQQTGFVGDNAFANILTVVLSFSALFLIVSWFVRASGYRRSARTAALVVAVVIPCLLLAAYRIKHVTGELVPEFTFRFAPDPDQLLDRPSVETATTPANLTEATDFDFPQFLGPARIARFDAVRLDPNWSSHPPKLVWRKPIGAGWSAFSAVNGFAVTMEQRGDEELVTCYEIATGRLVWSFAAPTRHSTVLGGVGPRSTPTIDSGRVYSVGATGTVLCLDGATGALVWRDNLLDRYGLTPSDDLQNVAWGRAGSALIVDELVVVPAGGPAEGTRHSLIAYQKQSGTVAWQSGDRQIGYASPVLASIAGSRQVVSVNEDTVSGHDPDDGSVLWEHPWPGSSTTDANNSQPVVLSDDRILVSKGYSGGAMMLQLSRSADGTYTVDELWRNRRVLKTKLTNVVVHNGYLYGLSDGVLECVDADDGSRQWKRGRHHHGQVLGVGDLLLVQEEHGDVVLVEASPERWNLLARLTALARDTWSNPCLHGRFLLVRSAEEACCYELPLLEN